MTTKQWRFGQTFLCSGLPRGCRQRQIADVTFCLTLFALTPIRCWGGGFFQTDMHRHPNRYPGVAGRLSGREQGFSPLERLRLVVLELLTSFGPCGGLTWLWGTGPGEWVGVLNSHSSSSSRKILQKLTNLGKSWTILQMHCCSPACTISR